MSLTSYLLASGTKAYEDGHSLITPVAKKPLLNVIKPSTYDYFLGEELFVSPVLQENVTSQLVKFPHSSDFVDYFNSSRVFPAGSTTEYACALDSGLYPLFHVQGSMLMRNIKPQSNAELLEGKLEAPMTVQIIHPRPGDTRNITIRKYQQLSQDIEYDLQQNVLTVRFSPHPRVIHLQLVAPQSLTFVSAKSGRSYGVEDNQVAVDCKQGEVLTFNY
jgi:alpha-glucosidase (family GH31 glycosyl hydrolase)